MGEKRDLKKTHIRILGVTTILAPNSIDCFDYFCTFFKQKQIDPFMKELKKD